MHKYKGANVTSITKCIAVIFPRKIKRPHIERRGTTMDKSENHHTHGQSKTQIAQYYTTQQVRPPDKITIQGSILDYISTGK
eukprot:14000559-Ditylum_brightwellii.AAC.1